MKMKYSKYVYLNTTIKKSQLYIPENKQIYHRLRETTSGIIYRCIVKKCEHKVRIKNLTCVEENEHVKHNHLETNEEKAIKNVGRIAIIKTMMNELERVQEGFEPTRAILDKTVGYVKGSTIRNYRKDMIKKNKVAYVATIIGVESVNIIPKGKIQLKNDAIQCSKCSGKTPKQKKEKTRSK